MAKRIEFIAPVESMRGNLSGKQDLKYAENENPAYEAPNGSQSAHNYQPRFIGAKRAKDGLKYFAVRTKQTSVLNNKTRTQMGILGCIAAIKSAVMALPPTGLGLIPWKHIEKCAAAYKEANPTAPDAKSVNTYFDARVRRMLRYRQVSYLFQETGVSGGWTLNNPYSLASSAMSDALVISVEVWVKFADMFLFTLTGKGGVFFTVDGSKFVAPITDSEGTIASWSLLLDGGWSNPNLTAACQGLTLDSSNVKFNGQQVYTSTAAVVDSDEVIADYKYSTIAPEA